MRIARARTSAGVSYGLVEDGAFLPLVGDPFGAIVRTGAEFALDDVELLHPVEPRRVLVILGGFLAEGQDAMPEGSVPKLFPKVVTEHRGPNAVIARPDFLTSTMDMEAELAVVIGQRVSRVSPQDAWQAILGFTVYNDVTAAEFLSSADFYRAKSIDGFSSFGPWVSTDVTREHISDGLAITGRINGATVQSGNTRRFRFDPGQVISEATKIVTLLPGDIIALGTPPPAQPIAAGDRVEAEVEGIGVLFNTAG